MNPESKMQHGTCRCNCDFVIMVLIISRRGEILKSTGLFIAYGIVKIVLIGYVYHEADIKNTSQPHTLTVYVLRLKVCDLVYKIE